MERKTIVITGSTRGIGEGLATRFLAKGHQVVINGRNEEAVNLKLKQFEEKSFAASGVAGDVTNSDTFKKIIKCAVDNYAKIDFWINNAGIPQSFQFFNTIDEEEIHKIVDVNIKALMMGTKAAINFFKEQGYGKIFNMEGFGSNGRMMDKLSLYGTTKRAVNYFSKAVSKEIREAHIQLGILSPGMVKTDFIKGPREHETEKEHLRTEKVMNILSEDVDKVTTFLVQQILKSRKKYDRIEYLTFRRLFPKIIRLMFVR
ncbi:MAG: SDR family oxidoreductase [Bacteroidales bacterium]|nr:SDR family oxidoreductase [Bacteroidales bacterium]MBN2820532.1 SDR family oxidoreductase [Bacteroidales bacterium]